MYRCSDFQIGGEITTSGNRGNGQRGGDGCRIMLVKHLGIVAIDAPEHAAVAFGHMF